MAILKKRWAAFVIAALIISLSTVWGANRSLGAACQEVSDSFYAGVYDSSWGTTRKSISSQLTKRTDAASGVETILNNYPELEAEASALKSARLDIINTDDIQRKYDANKTLTSAFGDAVDALNELDLPEREQKMVSEYSSAFKGAQNTIDESGYNDLVREFERSTLNVFPTNLLKTVALVNTPVLFE